MPWLWGRLLELSLQHEPFGANATVLAAPSCFKKVLLDVMAIALQVVRWIISRGT